MKNERSLTEPEKNVDHRMQDFSNNIKEQMMKLWKHGKYFTLAFNELYDIWFTAQLVLCFVLKGFQIY